MQPLWIKSKDAIVAWAISRAIHLTVAYLALLTTDAGFSENWRHFPQHLFLDGLSRWDGAWYVGIAVDGYENLPNSQGQRDVAFFPLYPLLIRALTFVVRDAHLAAILLSNLVLLPGLVWFHDLVRNRFDQAMARRALILFLCFPWSVFLGVAYTESLFFSLAVGAFWAVENDRRLLAFFMAGGLGLTKVVGAAIGFAVFLRLWERKSYTRQSLLYALPLLAACTTPLLYVVFLWLRFGDPLAFVSAQNASGWLNASNNWDNFRAVIVSLANIGRGHVRFAELLGLAVIAPAFVLAIRSFRLLGPGYAVFALAVLSVSLSGWYGFGRFSLVVFPCFIAAAHFLRTRRALILYVLISLPLALRFIARFALWKWVA